MKAMIYDWVMQYGDDHELVTKGFLKKELHTFGQQLKKEIKDEVCFEIRNEMDSKFGALYENMKDWKDEILSSNDVVIKKLDTWLTERSMIHVNYERLEARVTTLEQV